ncbi:hypothetical protein LMG28140_04330 [Paraburkholderia metrosideri]|jgi:hypothetical protein|uniref:Uncharacterized protein n=1 Tax=Paraburkholderia metrosideri TaxID=580937 RepID=A0ABM8NW72_9BURK|nr:hypothetical protein LMG28140_04330 [Paraburkholderia metrosideri]
MAFALVGEAVPGDGHEAKSEEWLKTPVVKFSCLKSTRAAKVDPCDPNPLLRDNG